MEATPTRQPQGGPGTQGGAETPGGRLLEAVAVMDRLRSPGGCPWDAQQTHASLAAYLLEEAHEAVEAIDSGDRDHLVEELGDVLLQVLFHARVGQEDADEPFDIDTVAGGLVEKLRRRHPHVFADAQASTPAEVEAAWERIKAQEKASRGGATGAPERLDDGIPAALGTLLRAEKVVARLERRGLGPAPAAAGDGIGERMLALVAEAQAAGGSADAELRRALTQMVEARAEHVGDADSL